MINWSLFSVDIDVRKNTTTCYGTKSDISNSSSLDNRSIEVFQPIWFIKDHSSTSFYHPISKIMIPIWSIGITFIEVFSSSILFFHVAFRTNVIWNGPGQKRSECCNYLNNWLCTNLNCQFHTLSIKSFAWPLSVNFSSTFTPSLLDILFASYSILYNSSVAQGLLPL